jgi:hypothetical protein
MLLVLCLALSGCTGGLLWEIADTRYPVVAAAVPGDSVDGVAATETASAAPTAAGADSGSTGGATSAPYAWVYPLVPLGYAVDLLVWPVLLLLQ